jgi:DNA-binding MarR family transcriptional regulator
MVMAKEMSRIERDALVEAIGVAVQRWQDATETFDQAVGQFHDLASAERRCLSFVSLGPQTASAIARETALTPAAVTALIDRLEARKLVRRRPDANDRRKVLVEATNKTRELIRSTYLPMAQAGARMLASYSIEELTAIRRFVEDALALQQRMTARLLERERRKVRG